jgi:hypothetical protein
MQPVFGNTTYHPEGVDDTFWPFEILREDTAGAEVAFGIGYGGTAAATDFSGQGTVLVGSSASVAINVHDDDPLEDTEDFTAYFSDALVPSDPGAFVIVDYPSTGQPSTDPDGDPFLATGYIVDGELMATIGAARWVKRKKRPAHFCRSASFIRWTLHCSIGRMRATTIF